MAFPFSIFSSSPSAEQPPASGRKRQEAAALSVDELRHQARVRLLGALVLVAVAIVCLPMLFSSQPRPVTVQTPVVIPDRDQIAPLPAPTPAAQAALTARSSQIDAVDSLNDREELLPAAPMQPAPQPAAPVAPPPVTPYQPQRAQPQPAPEKPARATRQAEKPATKPAPPAKAAKPAVKPAEKTTAKPAAKPAEKHTDKPAEKPAEKPVEKPRATAVATRDSHTAKPQTAKPAAAARENDGERARALLEGHGSKLGSRFVIQIGAYADAASVNSARQKAERAGVKTYTQVVQTASGQRTRVRVGPFHSREEADKAAAALKRAGLPSGVQSF